MTLMNTQAIDRIYLGRRDGNWRIVFAFEGDAAVLVDYRDYH